MPAVIILRREARNDNGATLELLRALLIAEQFPQRETEAFDPVLGREVDGRERGQTAVRGTGGDEVVVRFGDGASGFFDLSGEELVEGGVLVRIWLDHLVHGADEVEALHEGSDVGFAVGGVVLTAHFLALGFKEGEGIFPVQGFFLLGAVVQ